MIKGHRVAIARIIADLIKADRIIDTAEMDCWNKICSKYSITKEIEAEAQSISFAEALETILSSGVPGLREDLLADCRSMTVSDGFCAHSEALIMIALILMLDSGQPFKTEMFSIPKANFNIDIATSLYIESDFDADTNNAIRKNYRALFKEFQLAGFHFVYPPNIIDHYSKTDSELFHRILSFLAPSMSSAGIENAYSSLLKMTTSVFCKDLLCNKCGITDLRNTYPCLLIKIGNSFVGETPYANYLKIEVDENILSTVQRFVDTFTEMLSSDIYVIQSSEERDSQFHFHGFYKQLLEIFLIRKNIRSKILIDPYKEEIFFPDADSKAKGLHRRERALYSLLLCSGNDGVSFNLPKSAGELAKYTRRLDKIQARYSAIYSLFGGAAETAPDLRIPEIRRPIFSCLRRSLKNIPSLYNPEDYNIMKNRDGVFSVNIDENMVCVTELNSDEPVPLSESTLFKLYKEA